jgi:hypothetical protein
MVKRLRSPQSAPGGGGCSVAEVGPRERQTEEFMRLTFELCKHLTTLSTAGGLLVLAVYRELTFDEWFLAATLILFGLTIVVALYVMAVAYPTSRLGAEP